MYMYICFMRLIFFTFLWNNPCQYLCIYAFPCFILRQEYMLSKAEYGREYICRMTNIGYIRYLVCAHWCRFYWCACAYKLWVGVNYSGLAERQSGKTQWAVYLNHVHPSVLLSHDVQKNPDITVDLYRSKM